MSRTNIFKSSLVILVLVAVCFCIATLASPQFRTQVISGSGQALLAHMYLAPEQPFPTIDMGNLSPVQQKIITISKREYAEKPISFDADVMKYSQGIKESWCADYVSWTLWQAGDPLRNPNSGSWRIPGTATMQEYFMSQHTYVAAGTYTPRVGDVAIYRHNRSHVNIVIAVHGGRMTTIGGNETGHLRLNTQSYGYGQQGLSGFGTLDSVAQHQ